MSDNFNLNDWLRMSHPKHRSQYNDMQWANVQQRGNPKYVIGDVMEFHEGGFGVISKVSNAHDGWPVSYETSKVEGMEDHPQTRRAWFYEGDFKKCIGKSPIHRLLKKK